MKNNNYPMVNNGLVGVYDYPKIIKIQSQEPVVIIPIKKLNEQYKSDTVAKTLKKNRTTNK